MKKQGKLLTLIALLGITTFLSACSSTSDSSLTSTDGSQITESTSSSTTITTSKTLVGAYSSPAVMSYSNFRPTYNYYLTTFAYETLELYDNNTYALYHSSSCFSAVILPEDSSDGTANERENSVEIYYGTYEAVTNDLDEDSLDVTLSVPYRLVENYDSTYFIDTAQWDDDMAASVSTDTTTYTASTYLASKAFSEKTILVSKTNYSFDYFELRGEDESDPTVTLSTDTEGLVGAYLSPSNFGYMNSRPAYNYYITYFTQQQILLYEDNTYSFNIYSSQFSALILPEEGSDATGNERVNYTQKFTGDYSAATNDLDETLTDLSLVAPSASVIAYDSQYYLDTDNWTDEMSEKSSITSGSEYLASVAFDSTDVILTESTHSFSYIADLVDPILV